jgi:predicted RNase H-like HicB family nuclease
MKYTVVVHRDEEETRRVIYLADVPSLPGCHTYGRTVAEAIRNAREAISVYLESLEIEGDPIPSEEASLLVEA